MKPDFLSAFQRCEHGSGQDRVWELVLWLVPALVAVVMFRHPFGFADLGWQLQLGRFMSVEGPFLHEKFVATHLGEALLPNAWLAQIAYARAYDWTGWTGLRAFDALLWISGPLLAVIPARLRGARPMAILYALVIGFAVAMPSASIRPQSFASLGFGLTLILIQQVRSWRMALFLGLPLFVVWQNLHPSVPIAVLVVGAVAAVQWLQHFAGKAERPVALTILAIMAVAAVFATPAGAAIIGFARYNATASLGFGATEWLPLWNPLNRYFLVTVMTSAAIALLVVVKEGKAIPVSELVPVLVTFVLALSAERFIFFYALAIVPLLARLEVGSAPAGRTGSRRIAAGHAVSALLVILVSLSMPFRPEPGNGRAVFAALGQRLHGGTVFCDPTLGGAIIFDGYPDWKVSFDGRFYLYRPNEIAMLQRAYWDGSVLVDIDRMYHPSAYALDASRSAALVGELAAHPEAWRRAYDNGVSVLFVRIAPPVSR